MQLSNVIQVPCTTFLSGIHPENSKSTHIKKCEDLRTQNDYLLRKHPFFFHKIKPQPQGKKNRKRFDETPINSFT